MLFFILGRSSNYDQCRKEHDIWIKIYLETDSIGEWEAVSCIPNYKNTETFSLTKLMRGN